MCKVKGFLCVFSLTLTASRGRRAPTKGSGTTERPVEQILARVYRAHQMIMYNACHWLIVGRSERCEKPCINDFCGIHRAPLRRRPGTEPKPCRKCGRGTKSETQLCSKPCRSDHAKKDLQRTEAKVRRLHPVVMQELLLAARRLSDCVQVRQTFGYGILIELTDVRLGYTKPIRQTFD